ncbi:MAG: ATP-binding protein [bacterium]|nr:ATP-binding protein [bacterium]
MKTIPREQIIRWMQTENLWWKKPHRINGQYYKMRKRAYFSSLMQLINESSIKRAVLLMGPRRVGKTVMIHHAIQQLINDGMDPSRICYLSVDHPLYNGCGLQALLDLFATAGKVDLFSEKAYIFFDEIQYLKDWEIHLKILVDTYPNIKFLASGSAAAALRLKSNESGAGRFTDFLLPPLTFYEYLNLLDKESLICRETDANGFSQTTDIEELNKSFVHYLNFGGYPEVIFSEVIQSDPTRFIKSDIVDKVLLRDLPGLYGIQDIQELNYLFTTLAFNTANEVSLEQLAQSSGVAKNTIKRYMEYLEAAFLVKTVHRIDRNARRFQRANYFKVYLTNPSIRSALFSPVEDHEQAMGALAETGIFSQWFHRDIQLHYARWSQGEVDIVELDHSQKPLWAVEVKWSDRFVDRPSELQNLIGFCNHNGLDEVVVTTKTRSAVTELDGVTVRFVPVGIYCYTVGYDLIQGRKAGRSVR